MTWIGSAHTCLVTGASAGIGLETARGLAALGATVVVAGRDAERTERACRDIRAATDNPRVHAELADFSSLTEVRALATRVAERGPLHVLVNNAGLWHPERVESHDGFEDTFAVNHLAHFLLANLLRDNLEATEAARVIHVSSHLHRKAKGIAFDDIHAQARYPRRGLAAYEHSKLANILFSNELARRLAPHVTSNAVHPGGVATRVTRQSQLARVGQWFIRPFLKTPAQGARTSLFVATHDDLTGVSGRYYDDCREIAPSPAALDEGAARRLWALSADLTGLHNDTA